MATDKNFLTTWGITSDMSVGYPIFSSEVDGKSICFPSVTKEGDVVTELSKEDALAHALETGVFLEVNSALAKQYRIYGEI